MPKRKTTQSCAAVDIYPADDGEHHDNKRPKKSVSFTGKGGGGEEEVGETPDKTDADGGTYEDGIAGGGGGEKLEPSPSSTASTPSAVFDAETPRPPQQSLSQSQTQTQPQSQSQPQPQPQHKRHNYRHKHKPVLLVAKLNNLRLYQMLTSLQFLR